MAGTMVWVCVIAMIAISARWRRQPPPLECRDCHGRNAENRIQVKSRSSPSLELIFYRQDLWGRSDRVSFRVRVNSPIKVKYLGMLFFCPPVFGWRKEYSK